MQKALVSDLSTIDKFKRLLSKANNNLLDLLLSAASDSAYRSECLHREFEEAWQHQLLLQKKGVSHQTLIPTDTIPPFYSCALIILNARGYKDAVKQYLEILAKAPYFSFHAAKILAECNIQILSYDKENSSQALLKTIDVACQYAADVAKHHLTPGYLLLAQMHFQSALFLDKFDSKRAIAHYEFTYKNLLIAQTLQPFSITSVSSAYQDKGFAASNEWALDSVESMMVHLLYHLNKSGITIVTARAKTEAQKESQPIIDDLQIMHDSDEEMTSLQFF